MKIINYFLVFVLLTGLVVAGAPALPVTWYGSVAVDGDVVVNQEMCLVNRYTSDELRVNTDTSGTYVFNLANLEQGYLVKSSRSAGDLIRISFCSVDSIYEEYELVNDLPKRIDFDIGSGGFVNCGGGIFVPEGTSCPVVTTTTIPTTTLPVDVKVDNNDDETVASIETFFGEPFNIVIANNKLSKLIDDEIEFCDDDDYDVKEVIELSGVVQTSLDDEEFGLTPYLVFAEGGIVYKYVFDKEIDISDVDDDEPLKINFLDEDISIIDATADSVTINKGKEYNDIREGSSVEFETIILTVTAIADDKVVVKCGGESVTVDEDKIEKICGIEVKAYDVFDDEDVADMVNLIIGEDIEIEIVSGDEYNDEFDYLISLPDFIGVVSSQDYNDLDDDYKPLSEGFGLSLPNDFANIGFSVEDVDYVDISVKVDGEYLLVKGDGDVFVAGTEEYDEVLVGEYAIFDDDEVIESTVRIGDSDFFLELGSLIIGNLEISLDMSDILYDGVSFAGMDKDYIDYFGLIFRDPENAVDDKKGFRISVPEERPEVTISIGDVDVVVTPTTSSTTTTLEPIVTSTTVTLPIVTRPTVTTVPTPTTLPDEGEGEGLGFLEAAFAALIVIVLGVIGYKYKWAKGLMAMWQSKIKNAKTPAAKRKAVKSAIKTATTVIKKDKAGKYGGG